MRLILLLMVIAVWGCGKTTKIYRPEPVCYQEKCLPNGDKILEPVPCPER